MSSERRIKSLKLRLKSLVTSLNLIKEFVYDFDEETQADEVPVRLESLIRLWSDYNTAQSELETLDEAAIDTHLKQRTTLESMYYHVKGFLLAHNKSQLNQSLHSPNQLDAQFPPSASQVRLPDVKLPVFDGKLENWMNFHDLFVSLVHSSVGLSNIQKFYYLRSSLSNAALQLIQTIPISANNYPVAWNLLLEHFQNSSRLKQAYVDALFDFASLKRESATELHSLVEKFEANVRILQQLGERTEYWDILLIRMLSIRLDPTTRRDWEEHSSTKEAITFKDLASFIQRRVTVLQSIQTKTIEMQSPTVQKGSPQRPVANHGTSQASFSRKCFICSEQHPLYLCSTFASLDLEEKEREVRRHQLCRNCLRKGHHARDCSSSSSCRKCRGRHHTQLCSEENSVPANSRTDSFSQSEASIASTSGELPKASVSAAVHEPSSYASTGQSQNILLATAVVKLIDDNGTAHLARALLDSGSECCFITENLSQVIKAQRKKISVPISGIGQSSAKARYKIVSTIRSRVSNYSTSAEFLVLPKVTIDLPTTAFDISSWEIPPGVHLADPSFHEAKQIDIVIGAEIFFELFKVPGRIPLGDSLPILVNSVLGWIVSGKVSHGTSTKPVISNVALVADRSRFMEHPCSTEEDATPSSSVEHSTRENYFCIPSNLEKQNTIRLPLTNIEGSKVPVEADHRRTIVSLVVLNPSFTNLHSPRLRTSQQTFADHRKQLALSRSISSNPHLHSFHPIIITNQRIHVGDQLQPYDCKQRIASHIFSLEFVSSHHEKHRQTIRKLNLTDLQMLCCITGARSTVYIFIAFLNSRKNLRQHSMINKPTTSGSTIRPFSGTGINSQELIFLHRSHSQVSPPKIVDTSHQELIINKDYRKAIDQEHGSYFEGFFEAVIRSAQKHFICVLDNHIQSQDDKEALLTQIEYRLNPCPLVGFSDDAASFVPPTPSHGFLRLVMK